MALMPLQLAYAQGADTTDANLIVVLICLGIIVGVCILAAIPVVIAAVRRLRQMRGILMGAVVWGLLMCLIAIPFAIAELQWSKERMLRIQSGYGDPTDNSGAPAIPAWLWAIPIIFYVGLLALALVKRKPQASARD